MYFPTNSPDNPTQQLDELPILPDITITVSTRPIEEMSGPDSQTFAYCVNLHNDGSESWKLILRHWEIVDATGRRFVVDGEGVVGEQPLLAPQARYSYESMASVNEAPAVMQGYYVMQNAWGEMRRAIVSPFRLGQLSQLSLN